MEHNNPFPFTYADDAELINFINNNRVMRNFPLSVIYNMVYKPFQYLYNNSISENLSMQCTISESSCNHIFF